MLLLEGCWAFFFCRSARLSALSWAFRASRSSEKRSSILTEGHAGLSALQHLGCTILRLLSHMSDACQESVEAGNLAAGPALAYIFENSVQDGSCSEKKSLIPSTGGTRSSSRIPSPVFSE